MPHTTYHPDFPESNPKIVLTDTALKWYKDKEEKRETMRQDILADAGENDLQDDLATNNADLEEEGKAVMALSAATVETVGAQKDAVAHGSGKQPGASAHV